MPTQTKLEVSSTCKVIKSLNEIQVTKQMMQNDERRTSWNNGCLLELCAIFERYFLYSTFSLQRTGEQSTSDPTQRSKDMPRPLQCNQHLTHDSASPPHKNFRTITDSQRTTAKTHACKSHCVQLRSILPPVARHAILPRISKLQATRRRRSMYCHKERRQEIS